MVDNVLLEKRNRYLGKLIRKTHDLTESVKLLSTIDRELYSQSGGTLTEAIKNLLDPIVVQRSGDTDNFSGLTSAVGKLQETVDRFSQLEKDLSNIGRPVFYIKAPTDQNSMNQIIAQIQTHAGSLDNHVIIKITNFLSNPDYRAVASKYEQLALAYNDPTAVKQSLYPGLIAAHTTLEEYVKKYILDHQSDQELINLVFNTMYPPPPGQSTPVAPVEPPKSPPPAAAKSAAPKSTAAKSPTPTEDKSPPAKSAAKTQNYPPRR